MKPVALMRVALLKPATKALLDRGLPLGATLDRIGLPEAFRHDEQLIPLHLGFRFFAEASRAASLPAFGFVAGEAASIASMGVLGRLLAEAPTLGDLIAVVGAATPTFSSGERWWLDVSGGDALFCHTFSDTTADGIEPADHYGIALAINAVRGVAGAHWTPPEAWFQTRQVAAATDCPSLFRGARLRFRQPFSAVFFPAKFLARPNGIARSPCRAPDDLARWYASAPATDFTGSLQQVMWSIPATDDHPRIRLTAGAVGVSVRTLQRHLAKSRTSFEELLRDGRTRLATWHLEHTDASVLQIALDLGYSDHAHFTRAFRRWTGLSPVAYRRERRRRPPGSLDRALATPGHRHAAEVPLGTSGR
jgi:AraC-like DNA-binding protein